MNVLGRLAGLTLIVRRSLRQHALSTAVTVLSVAMACGLVMAVFSLSQQSRDAFIGGPVGFDAVLGGRGSSLQLVLNTVFHLEASPGNIPWSLYQSVKNDKKNVKLAIPYAVGDNYHGYRIVGTTPELFEKLQYKRGRAFKVRPGGRLFDPQYREAVVGSIVARQLGIVPGAKIHPYHDITFDPGKRHDEEYLVVGVLEPTNSPSDRVVWIPIEGVYRLGGHELRGGGARFVPQPGQPIPDEAKEVSAVLLQLTSPRAGFELEHEFNKQGKVATLAYPIARVMADLFNKIGWIAKILELVAYLVVLVAAAGVLASLYNTMNERRREFAILRSLGARRRTVFSVILAEATTISVLGALLGYAVYAAIMVGARWLIQRETGVVMDPLAYHPALVLTPLGMLLVGALSGLLPALKAYRTDVAANLLPTA